MCYKLNFVKEECQRLEQDAVKVIQNFLSCISPNKGLSHNKKCGSLLTCPPVGGLFLRKWLKALKMLGFIKKQKAPHLLVNGVQW